MKRLFGIMLAGVLVAGLSTTAMGQGRPGPGKRMGPAASRPAGDQKRMSPDRLMERLTKELNLTEQQQTQVKQILQTQHQALQNWRKENGQKVEELHTQIREAMKANDMEKVKATRAELQKVMESRWALHENLIKQLGDVLKPDQMEKAREILREGRPGPGGPMQDLNLTPEQKQQRMKIMDEARAKAQATEDPKAKAEIWKAAMEKVYSDVLTPEQRKQVDQMKKRADFFEVIKKLDLTDDQKKQIEAIRQETKTKVDSATTPQQKKEIIQAGFKKINETVLTEAQREQLKQLRAEWQKDHPRGRMGPGSRPLEGGPEGGPRSK
jgi:Spy/CpxP family protein refolding chaperone